MKALLIGGTGTISLSISKRLLNLGWELSILNRGSAAALLPGAEAIVADMNDEEDVAKKLEGRYFDVVAQFIAFTPEQIERDIRLFGARCGQYIFISSASAYQKPPVSPYVTESTPLHNPYWQYSRDKARCEDVLLRAWREEGFPVTIVRPSHTFSEKSLPLGIHGKGGAWGVISRILAEKPVLMPGDGTSLWTVTWADDLAPGFIGLMGNQHAIGQAVHITSDEALTWNQIHKTVCDILGKPFLPCYVPSSLLARVAGAGWEGALLGDKANCALFDMSRLRGLVPGFVCPTRFDQAARISLAYILSHPELQKPDPAFDAFSDEAVRVMQQAGDALAAMSL